MRAKLGVPLVLVLSTILAGVVGMGAATGQTVLHLVISANNQKVQEVYLGTVTEVALDA
mgnify:CR=1 FL=1